LVGFTERVAHQVVEVLLKDNYVQEVKLEFKALQTANTCHHILMEEFGHPLGWKLGKAGTSNVWAMVISVLRMLNLEESSLIWIEIKESEQVLMDAQE